MSRYKFAFAVALIFVLSMALIGCASSPAPAPAPAPAEPTPATPAEPTPATPEPPKDLTKFTVGFTSAQPNQSQLAFYLAQYLGYWAEEGLDGQFEWTSGSSQAIQLLSAGQIDVTNANHDALIFAVHQGAGLKAVFQEHTKCEFVFAVPADSPLQTIADLKGKKIGVSSLSSGFVPFAKAAFFEEGLDYEKDLNLIEVGSGATAATAITTGEVDVLGLWEVALANLESTLGVGYFRFIKPPIYDRLACNAIMTSDNLINNHPDEVIGIMRGIAKATLFMQTNPEAAINILYEVFPETKPQGKDDATIMKEALHTAEAENFQRSNHNRPQQNPMGWWGYLVSSEFEAAQDVHYKMGSLDTKLPVESFMTNQFVEFINDFDSDAIIKQAQEYK